MLAFIPRSFHPDWVDVFIEPTSSIMFGALLLLALSGSMARLWEHPFLTFFGKYSYGIYVIHYLILPALFALMPPEHFYAWAGMPIIGQLMFYLYAIGVSAGLALLSWYLVEVRFLRLKRHFTYGSSEGAR